MNEIMSIENYTDTYGGRNYAEYPMSINGEKLKENLNNNKNLIIIILYKWGKNMNVDKKRAAALFIILIMVLSGVASFMLLVL